MVPSPFDHEYENFEMANKFIFSALTYNIVFGTALTKILAYETTQDGRRAWQTLTNWYEGQGSTETMAKRTMDDLQNYKLTSSTSNGAEGY